jgi:predicted Rossmann fold nucleotide-binding protein DprA/Smf involved in DNA uptake
MTVQGKSPSRGEVLKRLRAKHAASVERAQALLKEQKRMQKDLCALLREKPRTVPEVAEATGIPADKVLWFLAAMRKYGIVTEAGMCGDYPLYAEAEEK